jgi:predicted O-linked N-acetylglucosamine transferase (SPINDLY family)
MNPQLQAMLQQAIQAFQSGNFDRADSTLKRVLQVDSKNLPALHILGLIKASQSNYREAAEYLARAARIHPDDASIQYNLAKALTDSGNDKDALTHHKKAVALAPNNPEAWLSYGKTASNLGRYQDALAWYSNALSLKPDYVEASLNKGATLKELGRYEEAIAFAEQALSISPNLAEAWSNKAIALKALKRYDEAIAHYDKALSLKPDYHEAWSNKGNALQELKRYDEAIAHYDKALSLKSDYAEAWSNKGVTLYELKRYDEAIAHYDKALSLKPDYAEAWSNKGNVLKELRRHDEAIAHYDKALSLKPDYHEAWSNKGNVLKEFGRYDEAIAHYDRALSLKPDYAEAWSNKGNVLKELRRHDEAIAHYDKALSLKSDYAEAWSNKGITLSELKQYEEAIAHCDKALSLKPDYAEAWSNKGITLSELKQYEEAIAHYDKALSLKLDIDWVSGDLLHTKMKICSWSGLAESLGDISQKVVANERVINPFPLLALNDDPLLHKKSSEIYIQSRYPFNPVLGSILKRPQSQKIRVAYFSADFHNHATGYLMAELFELHDKSQFELVGFSFGPMTNDEMRKRLEKSFDQFIELGKKSDVEVAQLSRDLNIDIAVDLKGITQDARTGIFAHRAAPIQVNYLGYPGTLGADYIDYVIADKTLIPPQSEHSYSEKVVYLPDSYQVNDRQRTISEKQFTRQELGLPEHGFVFCCFNNNYKILPATFEGWMRILKAVEGSVLWLFQDNFLAAENLKKEAEKQGITADRLVFAERLPLPEHLARHRQGDLFLDTLPYNAHTTTSDALWSGLPVLTLMGRSFASRVAASLLNAIGLPELITSTQEEYETLAIDLAKNPSKLTDIKNRLANNRLTTPLFDTPLFTKNLEAAYIEMIERYQADLKPDHITIA